MATNESSSKADAGSGENEGLVAKTDAKIAEVADGAANAAAQAQRRVEEIAAQGGNRLQEVAQKARHRTAEVATKVIHSAQETAQKVVHRAKQAVTAAEHRLDQIAGKPVGEDKDK